MLQSDPPPKAVKVTLSKRVPLVGDELAAYEEEQEKIKKEEALKASLVKEEESKAVVTDVTKADPMNIDGHAQVDGILSLSFSLLLSLSYHFMFSVSR